MTTTLASSSSDLLVAARSRGEPVAHGHDHAHAGHDHASHGHGSVRGAVDVGHGHAEVGPQGGGRRSVEAPAGGLSLIRASLAARLAVAAGLSVLIWAAVLWARLPIAS